MIDEALLKDYQCPICKNKEYRILPISPAPHPAMNYEVGMMTYSINAECGVICMRCGHIDYYVDIRKMKR